MSETELDRLEAAARLGGSLRTVENAAARVQELVASLRSYTRGADGRGPLIDDVDIAGGLDDALRLLSHRMNNVSVRRDFAATPGVTARPGELQQVWTNLLANALDAMHDEGQLTVLVGPSGRDRVTVRIIDDGPGIASELLEKIFAPRFTTKNGRVTFGLGLGLSISRQIIDDHGGTITVDSVPGRTEFTVELPQGERATGETHE